MVSMATQNSFLPKIDFLSYIVGSKEHFFFWCTHQNVNIFDWKDPSKTHVVLKPKSEKGAKMLQKSHIWCTQDRMALFLKWNISGHVNARTKRNIALVLFCLALLKRNNLNWGSNYNFFLIEWEFCRDFSFELEKVVSLMCLATLSINLPT